MKKIERRKCMVSKVVEQILQHESDAQLNLSRCKEEAAQKAKDMIDQAKQQALDSIKKANEQKDQMVAQAVEQAEKNKQSAKSFAQTKRQEIRESAVALDKQTVEIVVKLIFQ